MLEVHNLSVGYAHKKEDTMVASGLNFSMRAGELVGVVGVNGVGKSTLIRTLGGVQPKLKGDILVNKKPLESYNAIALAAFISMVLTEGVTTKNMSVSELVELGRQPYTNWIGTLTDKDRSMVTRVLKLVGIQEFKDKKCYELSDGQWQKVMIARALSQDTEVMLLDEPTTHLDLYHKVQVLKLLQQIAHESKKAVLYTTHEIDLALQLCDKMLIMHPEKATFGTPSNLASKGVLETIFPADAIEFDPLNNTFKVKS